MIFKYPESTQAFFSELPVYVYAVPFILSLLLVVLSYRGFDALLKGSPAAAVTEDNAGVFWNS